MYRLRSESDWFTCGGRAGRSEGGRAGSGPDPERARILSIPVHVSWCITIVCVCVRRRARICQDTIILLIVLVYHR